MIGIVMFFVALFALLLGFPVAFTFGGIALIFGVWAEGMDMFAFMPYRIQSIMENTVLMAVPLFVFMGLVLQNEASRAAAGIDGASVWWRPWRHRNFDGAGGRATCGIDWRSGSIGGGHGVDLSACDAQIQL